MAKLMKCRHCGRGGLHVTARRCPRCAGKEPCSRPLEIVIVIIVLICALLMAWRFWPY